MRVLLQNRASGIHALAGDSVQLEKTGEYLIKLGVDVTYRSSPDPDLDGFNLVHLFNLIPVTETYRQFMNAKRQNKPVLLSPVFWNPHEYLEHDKKLAHYLEWWEKTMPLRRAILDGCALILPNSRMELAMLADTFGRLPQAEIIPNGADRQFASARPEHFYAKYGKRDFLLSVGRICRRKNQVQLIRAARRLKLPLVLIGPLNDSEYYLECRKEAAGHQVLFIDTLSPKELSSAYAAARVHALVSWYDTPGLVSLEAALAGCRIVSTDRGSAREYFGNAAEYCDPSDLNSICLAISRAWQAPYDPGLKEEVLKRFTWEHVAAATYRSYQTVLAGGGRKG